MYLQLTHRLMADILAFLQQSQHNNNNEPLPLQTIHILNQSRFWDDYYKSFYVRQCDIGDGSSASCVSHYQSQFAAIQCSVQVVTDVAVFGNDELFSGIAIQRV